MNAIPIAATIAVGLTPFCICTILRNVQENSVHFNHKLVKICYKMKHRPILQLTVNSSLRTYNCRTQKILNVCSCVQNSN